jgi:hypothetical protein
MTKIEEVSLVYGVRYLGRKKTQNGERGFAFTDILTGSEIRVLDLLDIPAALLVARDPKRRKKRARQRAEKLSGAFHGFEPRKLHRYEYEWPDSLVSLGRCAAVDYISDKFDGKVRRYTHEFEGVAELLADPEEQSDGTRLLIIRGDFLIEPDGITG